MVFSHNSDIGKALIRGSNFVAVQSPNNNGYRLQINDSGIIAKGSLTNGTVTKWENILTSAELSLENGQKMTLGYSNNGDFYLVLYATSGERRQITINENGLYYGYNDTTGQWHDIWHLSPQS